MGDRCWIELFFKKEDEKKFDRILGDIWDEVIETNGVVRAMANDADNALDLDREQLAELKFTFYGYHGGGANYSSMCFACFKGNQEETYSNDNGQPVVRILKNKIIDLTELENALIYLTVLDKAKKYIEG